jgi:hypothetical protein
MAAAKFDFFATAEELGYRPLEYHRGMYLLASVDPEHGERFPGCMKTPYRADATRERLEVIWHEHSTVGDDD